MALFAASSASLAILVLGFAWFVSQNQLVLLNNFGGRTTHPSKKRWEGHGSYGNQNCWINSAGSGCEDVKLHWPSNTAFLACGDPRSRLDFYPPAGRHNPDDERYEEYFIKYDLKTNQTVRLQIQNWDKTRDLLLHGFDIQSIDGRIDQITILAVNHDRDHESILSFSHTLGTDSIRFIEEFIHPLIRTPNEVAVVSSSSFFVSNDHYFYKGKLRNLEDAYGPFKWASNVVFCHKIEHNKHLECQIVTPTKSHAWANGILLVDAGRTLMVNDVVAGTTTAYDVESQTKQLTHKQTIFLGASPDNLSEDYGTGDLIVSAVPSFANISKRVYGEDPVDYDTLVEAAVIRLVKAEGYKPELLYWDTGSLTSILTGCAYSSKYHRLIAGGVWERHFIVCDLT